MQPYTSPHTKQDSSTASRTLVLVVTHNASQWLHTCLSPFAQDREGIDLLVVDKASEDDTLEILEEEYPFVEVHARTQHLGSGAANNLGLELALVRGYQGVFLLNQDAQVEPLVVRQLADIAAQHPTCGVLSPTHLGSDGKTLEAGFAQHVPQVTDNSSLVTADFVNAALWYLPRTTLQEVGLFNPLFSHYGEDVDYCHRIRAAGLHIMVSWSHFGIHARASTPASGAKQLQLMYAYHLSEYCNPLYTSTWQRTWRGPIKLWGNGIKALLRGQPPSPIWKLSKKLWALRKTISLWMSHPPLDLDGLLRAYRREAPAPVLLLAYNRPKHTKRVLSDFWRQPEAEDTLLYILCDGAKNPHDPLVEEVQNICRAAATSPNVTLWTQPHNVGLAHNVTEGVSRVLQHHDRVIVLEDDLHLSPYLLRWMNDNLETHQADDRIAHIHAGTFYAHRSLPHNHLLSFAGSWGWATWRDRWEELWEPDGTKLLTLMEAQPELRKRFDYGGYMRFTRMLRQQTQGQNSSWAIRWHANIVLHHKLSINASPPLVSNDGFDGTGTHSGNDRRYRTPVSPYPLYAVRYAEVKESATALQHLRCYYRRTNNKLAKGYYKLRSIFS